MGMFGEELPEVIRDYCRLDESVSIYDFLQSQYKGFDKKSPLYTMGFLRSLSQSYMKKHVTKKQLEKVIIAIIAEIGDSKILLKSALTYIVQHQLFSVLTKLSDKHKEEVFELWFQQVALSEKAESAQEGLEFAVRNKLIAPEKLVQLCVEYRNSELFHSIKALEPYKSIISKLDFDSLPSKFYDTQFSTEATYLLYRIENFDRLDEELLLKTLNNYKHVISWLSCEIDNKLLEKLFEQAAIGEYQDIAQMVLEHIADKALFSSKEVILDLAIKYRNAEILQQLAKFPEYTAILSTYLKEEYEFLLKTKAPTVVRKAFYSLEEPNCSLTPFAAAVAAVERDERKHHREKAPYRYSPWIVSFSDIVAVNRLANKLLELPEGAEQLIIIPDIHWCCAKIYKGENNTFQIVYFDSLLAASNVNQSTIRQMSRYLDPKDFLDALSKAGATKITLFVNAQMQQHATFGCREFAMQVAEKMNVVDGYLDQTLLSYASNPKRLVRREKVMLAEDLQCDIISVNFPLSLLRGTQSTALYKKSHSKFRLLGRTKSELDKPISKKGKPVAETFEDTFADKVISGESRRVNVFNDVKREKRFRNCKKLFSTMPEEEILRRVENILIEGDHQSSMVIESSTELQSGESSRDAQSRPGVSF